jgi:hypothetical protein
VLQAFYRAADNSLRAYWRDPNGAWRGEHTIGGSLGGDPCAAAVPGTGVLQVFYRAPDNTLRAYWREPAGTWQGEQTIGGSLAGNPYTALVP